MDSLATPHIKWIESTPSTSTLLSQQRSSIAATPYCLATREQTAGRGQRGNSWEAEPGANLTFSLLLRPRNLHAAQQFRLSQVVSLAMCRYLASRIGDATDVHVKWPNDIYYRNSKISGILIENSLTGPHVSETIVGVGLNINQEVFRSDAPNPISLRNVTGRTYDIEEELRALVDMICSMWHDYECGTLTADDVHSQYMSLLWRGTGSWPFHDVLRGDVYSGRIVAVASTGHLSVLADNETNERVYAFKEVEFVH